MKNVARIVFASAAALGLLRLAATAQAEDAGFGLLASVFSDQGYVKTSRDLRPPAGFDARFLPRGGSMTLDKEHAGAFWDLGLAVEPSYQTVTGWEFGLPIQYSLSIMSFLDVGALEALDARSHWLVGLSLRYSWRFFGGE